MSEGKWKKKARIKLNKIVDVIREKQRISLDKLCLETNVAFSTMYHYKGLILALFDDIGYEEGEFYVKEE